MVPSLPENDPIVKEFKELEKGKLEVVQINIEEESALADLYTVIDSIILFIPATERGGFVETIRRDELG